MHCLGDRARVPRRDASEKEWRVFIKRFVQHVPEPAPVVLESRGHGMAIDNRTTYDTKQLRILVVLAHAGLSRVLGPLPQWSKLRVRVIFRNGVMSYDTHPGAHTFFLGLTATLSKQDYVRLKLEGVPVRSSAPLVADVAGILVHALRNCYSNGRMTAGTETATIVEEVVAKAEAKCGKLLRRRQ